MIVRFARALTPYSVGPFCLAHSEETKCQRVYVFVKFLAPLPGAQYSERLPETNMQTLSQAYGTVYKGNYSCISFNTVRFLRN